MQAQTVWDVGTVIAKHTYIKIMRATIAWGRESKARVTKGEGAASQDDLCPIVSTLSKMSKINL